MAKAKRVGSQIAMSAERLQPQLDNMIQQMITSTKDYEKDRARVRSLSAFIEDASEGKEAVRSVALKSDREEIRIYYRYRDELEKTVAKLTELNALSPKLPDDESLIERIELRKLKILDSMKGVLTDLTTEFSAKEKQMTSVLMHAMDNTLAMKIHQDKMDMIRQRLGDEPTDEELREIIARDEAGQEAGANP